jgi:ABC-type bacteriocin/lantibiotic exporter with double-glycine peptidase domain
MLARSLVGNPKLILLEEEFNHLSNNDKHKLIDYLMTVDSTVVVISNERTVASRFDKAIVLKDGALIASGKVESFEKESWFENTFN